MYAVKPPDFTGVIPKLCVRIGDKVEAGTCIFYDKKTPVVQFLSPVAGTVKEIVRGAKRRILAVEIEASENPSRGEANETAEAPGRTGIRGEEKKRIGSTADEEGTAAK